MRRAAILWLAAVPGASAASAQDVVTSAAPEAVAVTIYRAPGRSPDQAMNLDWLGGYALVTETRMVTIPAGRAIIRFEGVAGGMLPESAIVTGLPAGVREKNLDAALLSPRSLYARSFGRPVILRRTHPQTGAVSEERAIVRSGPDGAVIVQTRDGFEAADCGPLGEALVYEGVPPGLSARPTLSVETEAAEATQATVALSYLAWGFDWQTHYVFDLAEGGRRAEILAWVTLASSDPTSFPEAEAAVVGGEVSRNDTRGYEGRGNDTLQFHCFFRPVADALQSAPVPAAAYSAEIIVTARRRDEKAAGAPLAVTVVEEGLGDLKLYRVPVPTTVAANAQKQVAMFRLDGVRTAIVHTADLEPGGAGAVTRELRMRNRREDGLGRALPAGGVAVFERVGETRVLSGEGTLSDAAIGQDVRVRLGEATQVSVIADTQAEPGRDERHDVTVFNANPWPVRFEGRLIVPEERVLQDSSRKLDRESGYPVWKTTVAANGEARLRYRLRPAAPAD